MALFEVEQSYKRYLWNRFFTWGGNALASIFITIYLWRLDHNFLLILAYYLLSSIATIISFAGIGAPITKERSALLSLRLGIIGYCLLYVLFFFLQERVITFFWMVAILDGIIKGVYWIADYTLRHDLSSAENRRKNVAAESLLIFSINFLAPLTASFIVTRAPDLNLVQAYAPVFIASLALYGGGFINSFFFKDYHPQHKPYALWTSLKAVLSHLRGRQMTRATLFGGIADSAIGLSIPLLLYAISSTELSIGWFEAFKVAITAIVLFITAKFITSDKYARYLTVFGVGMLLAHFVPSLFPNIYTIFAFGAIVSTISPLLDTLWVTLYYNTPIVICKTQENMNNTKTEYFVLQEIAAGIGRMLSLVALLIAYLYAQNLMFSLQVIIIIAGIARFMQYYQCAKMKLEDGI